MSALSQVSNTSVATIQVQEQQRVLVSNPAGNHSNSQSQSSNDNTKTQASATVKPAANGLDLVA